MALNLTPLPAPLPVARVSANSAKIILDLCGGTGSWSRPYAEAGYDVRVINTPEYDVRTFVPPPNVYGILAAPPCTMFSPARRTAILPADPIGALVIVDACLAIVRTCQLRQENKWLKFWAMENPRGLLRKYIGRPPFTFQPCDYGDPHTKQTDIWGEFNTDLVRVPVAPRQMPPGGFSSMPSDALPAMPAGYRVPPDMDDSRSVRRSMTPQGFARAFFNANR